MPPNSIAHSHPPPFIWQPEAPWWELIFRNLLVYSFLLVILRLTGKRQIGEMAPFDLVLLLLLSNAVQNSMTAGDNSLTGGLISAATLVAINYLVGFASFRNKTIEKLMEGRPQLVIHNGKLYKDVLDKAQISQHELNEALRLEGCLSIGEVHAAFVETNGSISVVPRKKSNSDSES